jgi:putative ABC transport system ATP-binding protein
MNIHVPLVAAHGLVRTYLGGQMRALDGMDFVAEAGDSIAIVGPSGSGKSTLLYALSGLIDLDAGEVRIAGTAPASAAAWRRLRARDIGMVFQEGWLLPALTSAENIELPMLGVVSGQSVRRERVRELLDAVGASSLGERLPASLSGGERQRIAIARSLANRPRILLADEPTGELDRRSTEMILDLLVQLRARDGLTLVIVTHDERVAGACARRFVVEDGKGHYVDR